MQKSSSAHLISFVVAFTLLPYNPCQETYTEFCLFDDGMCNILHKAPFGGQTPAELSRERLISYTVQFFKRWWRKDNEGHLEGAVDSVTDVLRLMKSSELNDEKIARVQNLWIWAAQANTSLTCTWLLNHLLVDSTLREALTQEVQNELRGEDINTLLGADPRSLEASRFPFLNSSIKELLRIYSVPTIVRRGSHGYAYQER
ncbi:hypothetical protein M422DRAFT_250431 [Sphaerobolus stellatus SS14]|uniref:Cytochrome P450 n=1 Tax=Sphaerobolus stellatus (strain SS14) TaxID=990650 RepID=A0A0C9W2W7_SPHS4|nr:hypothetical protein M422DRAFT_250431 [Sphaerobolus stellatus SS14]